MKGLDEASDKMLKKIIAMDDLHPNAVVFKLRTALALARNEVFYGQKKWDSLGGLMKDAHSLYLTYLNQRNNVRVEALSREEEIEIIRLIQIEPPRQANRSQKPLVQKVTHPEIIQRLRVLLGKQSGEQTDPLVLSKKFMINSISRIWKNISGIGKIFTFKFNPKLKNEYLSKATDSLNLPKINGPIHLQNKSDFEKLYPIARYGSKEQKSLLWRKLQLNDTREETPFYVSLIKCALTFPLLFSLVTFTKPFVSDYWRSKGKWKNRFSFVARIPAYALLLVSSRFLMNGLGADM